MRKDYDIEDAFAAIEDELIDSMIRNMKRHRIEEVAEDKQWEMWQALQLKSLEEYKKKNQKKFTSWFSDINKRIEEVIKEANRSGYMDQELEILDSIKKGFKDYKKSSNTLQAEFFKLNERKLEALIKATTDDMQKAEIAILRMANDQYRKVIFNAQVYANSGAGTYEKAVDMATKDMLSAGLNCVEYANGARHTLKDYADMALRTASKRAYLQGEGTKRQEWGISTVIMNKRGNPCPKCLPFCGKVLIDDVWSGGSQKDGPYPLMSEAIAAGLYHPRCKDSHTTYFEGINKLPNDKYTKREIKQIENDYRTEHKQQYAKRQAEKFGRLEKYSLDANNRREYALKARNWNKIASMRFENYDELEKYMNKEYNGIVDVDVRKLNIGQVSKTLTEFETVIADFPQIRKIFSQIGTTSTGTAALASNGALLFNPTFYNKLSEKNIGAGFHEAGHLMEIALIKKYNPSLDEDMIDELYEQGIFAQKVIEGAYSRIKTSKSIVELRREISRYSLTDESETLAEAVEDYYCNGYSASILSRQIIRILEEELR